MPRLRRHSGRELLLLLPLLVLPSRMAHAIDWTDPPQGVFSDDWMIVELEDQKVGYVNAQMARDGDEITTTNLMTFVLKRAGAEVAIKMLATTRESLSGEVRTFSSRMDASAQSLHKQGRVENSRVYISSKQFDSEMTSEHPFPRDAVMSWGALRKQHEMGHSPGTKYTVQLYEPMFSEGAAIPVETTIGEKEEIKIDGQNVQAIRSTQQMLGMTTTSWLDGEYRIVRSELPMMGIPMVMTRTTREDALAEFSPPEFFMPTTIRSPRPIDRAQAKTIEYVVRLKNDTVAMPELPVTGMQRPSDADKRSVRLAVSRQDHAALEKVPATRAADEDLRPYLAPNAIINSDDPVVREMANAARADAQSPYEIADRLRRYVTDAIEDKNLNVGFATASEVARNKEGDCSEHAVLLAALGRACGLPARVVTGLVYVPIFGGSDDIFGFHMWTQFRIGDAWVDFDAAQHESDCNPTHIAFSVSSLEGAGIGQIAIDLINLIGNLEIDIVRIDPSPPTGK